MSSWIGVDLDGTLAYYDSWKGPEHIGDPVPIMAQRVREWLRLGKTVKIFTARASEEANIPPIKAWLKKHGFPDLAITNKKDFGMVELWDDRCIEVMPNTGMPAREFWGK